MKKLSAIIILFSTASILSMNIDIDKEFTNMIAGKLIVAIQKNDIVQVRALLKESTNEDNRKIIDNKCLLNLAVTLNRLEIGNLFLQLGADINKEYPISPDMPMRLKQLESYTPLLSAIKFNNLPMVEFLLANGADIDYKNKKGLTPLHSAMMLENKIIIQKLIQSGADIDMRDNNAQTPIEKFALNVYQCHVRGMSELQWFDRVPLGSLLI